MNPSRVRWGFLLILIGFIFLANNIGWLSWWVWADLLNLWPVLLIAIGLEIIFKKSKVQFLGYISTLLIVAAFAYAISVNGGVRYHRGTVFLSSGSSSTVVNYEDESDVDVTVKFSDGRLLFNDGQDYLVKGTSRHSRNEIDIDTRREQNYCKLEITPDRRFARSIVNRSDDDNNWKFDLHSDVNYSYDFDLNDADLRFYGDELIVDTLLIEARSSRLIVRLGNLKDNVYLEISGRRTDCDLYLPDSCGLRLEGETPSAASVERFNLLEDGVLLTNDLYGNAVANFSIKTELKKGKLRIKKY